MTFEEILDQAIAMLQRRGRLTYGTLKRQFQLDDAALEDLTAELIEGQRLAVDEDGRVLVWTGGTAVLSTTTPRTSQPAPPGPPLTTQAVHPPQTAIPPATSLGRHRARYLTARLPMPPVRPVRETFTSYGSRERGVYRKLPFRHLHGTFPGVSLRVRWVPLYHFPTLSLRAFAMCAVFPCSDY